VTATNATVEPTAHQRLRLLTSPEIVLERVEIIHYDWIELRLLDKSTGEHWIVEPYQPILHHLARRQIGPRIVGEIARRIAERHLPTIIKAIEAAIADHQERATWDYDVRHAEALRDYHRDFQDALANRLAAILARRNQGSI
jgi:hypothetical protein